MHAWSGIRDAGPHIRLSVHLDPAIEATSRGAEHAARAAFIPGESEQYYPSSQERGSDGFTLIRYNFSATGPVQYGEGESFAASNRLDASRHLHLQQLL